MGVWGCPSHTWALRVSTLLAGPKTFRASIHQVDPQLSYTLSEVAVVNFGVATNRKWVGPNGNQREEICFVDCRAFRRTAENISKYFNKGKPIFLEGRLTFDSWTARDGSKRSKLRVTVESFQFLPGTNGKLDQADEGSGSGPAVPELRPAESVPGSEPTAQNELPAEPVPDDDIPF